MSARLYGHAKYFRVWWRGSSQECKSATQAPRRRLFAVLTLSLAIGLHSGCAADTPGDLADNAARQALENRRELESRDLQAWLMSIVNGASGHYAEAVWAGLGEVSANMPRRPSVARSSALMLETLHEDGGMLKNALSALVCEHDVDACATIDALVGGQIADWPTVRKFAIEQGFSIDANFELAIAGVERFCGTMHALDSTSEPFKQAVCKLCVALESNHDCKRTEPSRILNHQAFLAGLNEVTSLRKLWAVALAGAHERNDAASADLSKLNEKELTMLAQIARHAVFMTERHIEPISSCVFFSMFNHLWSRLPDKLSGAHTSAGVVSLRKDLDKLRKECDRTRD